MLNTTHTIARPHRAGAAAVLADGHHGAWQLMLDIHKRASFVLETSTVTNPKVNRAWGPPSA